MARQKNDGRGRMGGRIKGTPNKTISFSVWADGFLNRNRQDFESDYFNLSADSRAKVFAMMAIARALFSAPCASDGTGSGSRVFLPSGDAAIPEQALNKFTEQELTD